MMPEPQRKPLVLVAEDDSGWQKDIVAAMTELGARTLTCMTVQGAVNEIREHAPGSEDPLDLIVLDMHVPVTEHDAEIHPQAGIYTLHYAQPGCPVVIFTSYQLYSDCLEAGRLGATAYVPKGKVIQPTRIETSPSATEGGIGALINTCRALLTAPPVQQMPSSEWIRENGQWLREQFAGMTVAFVSESVIRSDRTLKPEPRCVRNGVIVIPGNSRDEVLDRILASAALLRARPHIAFVAEIEGLEDAPTGKDRSGRPG